MKFSNNGKHIYRLAYWLVSLLATKSARVQDPPRVETFHSQIKYQAYCALFIVREMIGKIQ